MISLKISKQMERRGWSVNRMKNTIENPKHTSSATNKLTGEGAIAYFDESGSYIVLDEASKNVIQISNRLDPKWIPDPTIKNPYTPNL